MAAPASKKSLRATPRSGILEKLSTPAREATPTAIETRSEFRRQKNRGGSAAAGPNRTPEPGHPHPRCRAVVATALPLPCGQSASQTNAAAGRWNFRQVRREAHPTAPEGGRAPRDHARKARHLKFRPQPAKPPKIADSILTFRNAEGRFPEFFGPYFFPAACNLLSRSGHKVCARGFLRGFICPW
jgi:hypothetical protein